MDAHAPAPYDKNVLMAVRAVVNGAANDGQQKMAMDWIINSVCNYYDLSYRPDGMGGARATDFHEGRRFCGAQIVKMLRPEALLAVEKVESKRKTRREANPND